MGNNNLKSMASIAKERLKRGLYTNAEKIKARNAMNVNSYFIKNINALKKINSKAEFKYISNEIDDEFVDNVYTILNSPTEVFNPIGRLVDQKLYDSLSDIEKQFYILNIADKYNKIKSEYLESYSKIS
ncbi:MAG: hypothetical protein MR288_01810 [Firmicutes bacterium]|nr:hypothetical protein [Bacillota bacterium]MDY5041892.1 hypothetical protein [Eubacteriales bacterium]